MASRTVTRSADTERDTGKPVTAAYLERAAVFYLERYASSSENLRRVLLRKARRRSGAQPDEDTAKLIDETVDKAIRSGLVDDAAYAGARLGTLLRRGASVSRAKAALAAKGIAGGTIEAALGEAEPDDFAQARRYAERRRLGPFRRLADPARRDRDLAALVRAGFSYRAATAALAPRTDEETEPSG
ncbi:regulatory protein RecX [Enterovirga rhinocerotis]|uniref:Regulatory protein RecX n=1 Tax=Enterovirga rhinocerotis TaxID=1339210 RepID=A0A4R7BU54_9HYPH|nr:RecX family transcriptional regulator [Enterovirga rhinocerotis]TDR89270.1 regulatory protein [Enterovirga rhinocerotis]